MKTIAFSIFFAVVFFSLTANHAPAQIKIQKSQNAMKAQKEQASQEDSVSSLVKDLSNDKGWWDAKKKLTAMAAEGRLWEILGALQAGWLSSEDPILHNRNKAVADAINRTHLGKLKEKELKDRMARMKTAFMQIQAALGKDNEPAGTAAAMKKAVDEMENAVKSLDESISSKLPLNVGKRFAPPGGGMQIESRETDAGDGEKKGSGYRMVRQGDKTLLIPSEGAGDGEDVKIIKKNDQVFIIREKTKAKDANKEEEK